MSKELTIWVVIGIYAVFMLAVGILNSKKGSGMAEFTVGGRNAGAWISALSYGTAYFSAVMFIGYSGGSAGLSGYIHRWWASETPLSALIWPGKCWPEEPGKLPAGSKLNPCPSFLKSGFTAEV